MKKGASASQADPQDSPVRLKPVFGVRPGIYLTVLYLILILLVLFTLFLLPGIRRYGTWLTVTSSPGGASVFVDGMRVGATPVTSFVPAGERELVVAKPFFEDERRTLDVEGRLLGSLIVPRKERVEARLAPVDVDALLRSASSEYAAWALTGPATERYPKPRLLSAVIRDLLPPADTDDIELMYYEKLYEFLNSTTRNTVSSEDAADLLHALLLAVSGGGAPSPAWLLHAVQIFIQLQETSQFSGFWLLALLPEEARKQYLASPWYEDYLLRYDRTVQSIPDPDARGGFEPLLIEGSFRFYRIPGGRFLFGRDRSRNGGGDAQVVPYPATVESFLIMDREVTRAMYARFLSGHPEWGPAGRERLAAEGLIAEEYLSDWGDALEPSDRPDHPVRYVSWYAADAFCRWLEERLPPSLEGYSVRLPSEVEWEYAARMAAPELGNEVFRDVSLTGPLPVRDRAEGGPADLLGNLWEWTGDWYYPASYLFGAGRAPGSWDERFPGAERVVKGGSWANARESISTVLRGAQPPVWSTPFIGFRPVLVRERNGS